MGKETQALEVRSKMQEKLQSVKDQLASLKAETESPYKTNGEFRFNPHAIQGGNIRIHSTTDITILLNVLAYLNEKSTGYVNAAEKILEFKNYPAFKWMGFTYESWEHDIKVRVKQLVFVEKKATLMKAKMTLESFMSEDDRLALMLNDLEKLGI